MNCLKHGNNYCYCYRRIKPRHTPLSRFANDIHKSYPYGYDYPISQKSVCWNCRLYRKTSKHINTTNCIKCRGYMVCVGQKFRPPKYNDVASWKKSQLLYEMDLDFYNYGNDGFDYPNTPNGLNIPNNIKFSGYNKIQDGMFHRYEPKFITS